LSFKEKKKEEGEGKTSTRWPTEGPNAWWPLKGLVVWWLIGERETSFSHLFTFPPNKIYLNLFFFD
jgi:hypothetical protein